MALCHECKIMKDKGCLIRCSFDSKYDGSWKSQYLKVADVAILNVDPLSKEYVQNLIKSKGNPSRAKRIKCNRYYCKLCLKY